MNRHELRKVDLNTMVIFERIMEERNVTRAAISLGISQPTATAALNRLRHALDDPLFIPNGRCIEPTSRATQIYADLSPALDELAQAISHTLK